ncbi:MAG: hypothetical protein Q8L78_02685 [Coxiellaceae bacterium]|nr:hypothetical protein [Coxiellaceae bacterium]
MKIFCSWGIAGNALMCLDRDTIQSYPLFFWRNLYALIFISPLDYHCAYRHRFCTFKFDNGTDQLFLWNQYPLFPIITVAHFAMWRLTGRLSAITYYYQVEDAIA